MCVDSGVCARVARIADRKTRVAPATISSHRPGIKSVAPGHHQSQPRPTNDAVHQGRIPRQFSGQSSSGVAMAPVKMHASWVWRLQHSVAEPACGFGGSNAVSPNRRAGSGAPTQARTLRFQGLIAVADARGGAGLYSVVARRTVGPEILSTCVTPSSARPAIRGEAACSHRGWLGISSG